MPLGLIAVEAAKAARAGADAPTIVRLVEGLKPRTKVAFVVATLEYLRRGGRIGGAQAFLGGLLSVKPVLHIHGGRVDPVTRVRTFAKAHEAIGAYVREHAPRGVDHGAIIHARAEEQRAALAALVQARYAPTGDTYADITIDPVVGTYTGPGAFGFAFVARA